MVKQVWDVGHSNRSIEHFIRILKSFDVETLVDVRMIPRSRANPQFNQEELGQLLTESGIGYIHMKSLGGLRKPRKDSPNTGWRNEGFRGYADYMQTPEFEDALSELVKIAESKRTAVMCAEAVPWRCHRSLLTDALTVRDFEVIDIIDEGQSRVHQLTKFAVLEDGRLTYPGEPDQSLFAQEDQGVDA